jgi:hypothetical protein
MVLKDNGFMIEKNHDREDHRFALSDIRKCLMNG